MLVHKGVIGHTVHERKYMKLLVLLNLSEQESRKALMVQNTT